MNSILTKKFEGKITFNKFKNIIVYFELKKVFSKPSQSLIVNIITKLDKYLL